MTVYTSNSRPRPPGPIESPAIGPVPPPKTWWSRINKAVIGAGALATAVAAVISLWPDGPVERTASFSSVRVTAGVPLGEYEQRLVSHVRGTAMGPRAAARLSPLAMMWREPSPDATDGPATTTEPTPATPSEEAGLATPSSLDEPSGAGSQDEPQPHRSGPPQPTSGVDEGQVSTRSEIEPVPTPSAPRTEVASEATDACRESFDSPDCQRLIQLFLFNFPLGANGAPLSIAKAAERTTRRLKDIRTTKARARQKAQPLGVVVAVDIELKGLRGRPITLSWSMWQLQGENRLYGDWLNENLAYRIKSSSQHDTASIDFWIPLPRAKGPYFVRSRLSSNGTALASADSGPFR